MASSPVLRDFRQPRSQVYQFGLAQQILYPSLHLITFSGTSSWNSRYLRRAGSCYKTLCRPLTIARERRRWTCLPLAKARCRPSFSVSFTPISSSVCLFLILRFVLLLHLLLSSFFSARRLFLLHPSVPLPPALFSQEYKDLDDPGCSGRPSGVTTTLKALVAFLFYDAMFLVPKIPSRYILFRFSLMMIQ